MLLLSTLTQILLGILVITAVLLGAVIGYFYVRVRRTESGRLTDKELATISQRDQEIAMIRSKIEEMHQHQIGASNTQNAVFRQQLEQMQEHLTARGRQIEGLQGQLRNEMAQRQQAMEELQAQMRELLSIVNSRPTLQASEPAQIEAPAHEPMLDEAGTTSVDETPVPSNDDTFFTFASPFAEEASAPVTTFVEEESFVAENPFQEETSLATDELFAQETMFSFSNPFAEEEPAVQKNVFNEGATPASPFAEESPVREADDAFTFANPFATEEHKEAFAEAQPDFVAASEDTFASAFANPFAPEEREEALAEAQSKAESFTWEPVILDFDFEEKEAPTLSTQEFRPDSFTLEHESTLQPTTQPAPVRDEPTFVPLSPVTKDEPETPSIDDGFAGVIEWTSFADEPPTIPSSGDGQIIAAQEPAPQPEPEPQPEHAEELTQLSMIDEHRQGILYGLEIYTIEDVARFGRADARRVAEAIQGTTEDEVMNEWVFAAQSILFERYQAELRRRRAQAA